MKLHEKTVHQGIKEFKCAQCEAIFGLQKNLDRHKKNVHENLRIKPYMCEICSKHFVGKRELDGHMNNIHEDVKPHKCDKCEKCFGHIKSLQGHVRSAHASTSNLYKCDLCEMSFVKDTLLKIHLKHVHEKSHSCNKCNKCFGTLGKLLYHEAFAHETIEKQHKCELCSKAFARKLDLQKHIKRHDKLKVCNDKSEVTKVTDMKIIKKQKIEKGYDCEHCEYKATEKYTFTTHVRRVHAAIKPYICKYCKKNVWRQVGCKHP